MAGLFVLCALIGIAQTPLSPIPKGAPIHVMLLREISSGGSNVGDLVPFVVTDDVKVGDETLLAEGAMIFGKISQARGEGALSAPLFDRPARLCIRFEDGRDRERRKIPIWPTPEGGGELQITREMTVVDHSPEEDRAFMLAMENPQTKPIMERLRKLFTDKAVSLSEKEAQVLAAHNIPIPFVQAAIRAGPYGIVKGFIADLKRGRPIEAVLGLTPATRPALLAVRAVRELGRLSGGIGGYLGGWLKGRNIVARPGVEITVYSG